MNITLSKTIFVILSLFLLGTMAFAQNKQDFISNESWLLKKSTFNKENNTTEKTTRYISPKVLKSFKAEFGNTNPSWYELNDYYIARFSKEGRSYHILYHQNGFQVYNIIRDTNGQLSEEVKKIIDEKYTNYVVGTITQASTAGKVMRLIDIHLKDQTVLLNIIEDEIIETTTLTNN